MVSDGTFQLIIYFASVHGLVVSALSLDPEVVGCNPEVMLNGSSIDFFFSLLLDIISLL